MALRRTLNPPATGISRLTVLVPSHPGVRLLEAGLVLCLALVMYNAPHIDIIAPQALAPRVPMMLREYARLWNAWIASTDCTLRGSNFNP